MTKTLTKKQLKSFVTTLGKHDSIFIFDERAEFQYEDFNFPDVANVKIIRSEGLLVSLDETISQICDYILSMHESLADSVKIVFISRRTDLNIPKHERFINIIIKED